MINPKLLFDFHNRYWEDDLINDWNDYRGYNILMSHIDFELNDGTKVTFRFNYNYPSQRQGQFVIETRDFVYRQSLKIWYRWGQAEREANDIYSMYISPCPLAETYDIDIVLPSHIGASCIDEPKLFVKKEDRGEAEAVIALFILERLCESIP